MVRPTSENDVLSRREDIDSKLQKELSGLNLLKETLQKSNQLAKGMTGILTSFEDRLAKLEETILPVYNNTSSLQRKQENIDKTLTALDHVISYYNVSNEVEQLIRDGPVNSLDDYMESLASVRRAISYFEKNNPESQELQNLNLLFDVGGKALEREFRILLNRYCKPTQPILILDMLGMTDDELCVEDDKAAMELLPEKAAKELTCIAKWLVQQNREDYMNVYATIRSNILLRSLQGFKDFLKSSSGVAGAMGGAPVVAHGSPAPIRSWYKDTPTRKTSKKLQQALLKKTTQPDIKYSQNSDPAPVISHGHRRQGSFFEIRDENFDDVYKYLKSFSALYKLMQCEIQLMSNIILRQHWKAIFERVFPASLDMIIQEGDTFAAHAKKCADKHDFSGSLIVFPILKHLITSKPEFRFILEESHGTICSKLDSLISTFHVTGTKILEDFIENIKNDQDRQMPKDGTVHEMTSNAVIFLEQLKDYAETVDSMLTGQDNSHSRDRSSNLSAAAYYIFRVLSVLGLTLNNKSDTYGDPYLRIIFRLNNLQYILKSLQRTGVLAIAKIHNSDLEIHYMDQILDMKRVYSQSWSRVLHYVTEVDRPLPSGLGPNSKLKDKDRQSIKDKFTGFNKEMDDICKVQKGYAIPDTELRESLKRENKDFILPKYEAFYNKYLNMNFTKQKEKYIKYTPIAVSSMMERFFDVAA